MKMREWVIDVFVLSFILMTTLMTNDAFIGSIINHESILSSLLWGILMVIDVVLFVINLDSPHRRQG